MTVYDAEAFVKAVQSLAEGDSSPYLRVATAQRCLESAQLTGWAFGPIGDLFVSGEYEQSRKFLAGNLKTGTDNLRKVLTGLNTVAKNYGAAEQANIVDPATVKPPKIEHVDGNLETPLEATGMLYLWKLGGLAMAIYGVNQACAKFAVSATVGTLLWAGFTPDDAALSKAHSQWIHAADKLAGFDDKLDSFVGALNKTWSDGPAWDAFSGYISKFRKEILECHGATDTGAQSLASIHDDLNTQQGFWFLSATLSLAALIALEIWGDTVIFAKPYAKVMQEVVGALLSVAVGSWTGYIVGTLAKVWEGASSLIDASFVTEKTKSSTGNGVDFKEVAMDQDALDTLVQKA